MAASISYCVPSTLLRTGLRDAYRVEWYPSPDDTAHHTGQAGGGTSYQWVLDRDNRGQAIDDFRCASRILLTGVSRNGKMEGDILIKKAWDNHRVFGFVNWSVR
jgi:hypothetical protein